MIAYYFIRIDASRQMSNDNQERRGSWTRSGALRVKVNRVSEMKETLKDKKVLMILA